MEGRYLGQLCRTKQHAGFGQYGYIVEARFLEYSGIFFILADYRHILVQRCAHSTIHGHIDVVGMDMRYQIIINSGEYFFHRHGKVIEGHRQMLLHFIRHMIRLAGNIDEGKLVLGHQPRVNQESFVGIFKAVGGIADLCQFHGHVSFFVNYELLYLIYASSIMLILRYNKQGNSLLTQ